MRGHDVVAVDIAPPMLAQLALKLAAAGPLIGSCRMVRADVATMPFADDTFEATLIASVLYLVPDWRAVITEVSRVLQPDGALLFAMERSESSPALERFDSRWREIIEATGYRHPPSTPDDAEVVSELEERATACDVRELVTWTTSQTVDESLAGYGDRLRPLYATVPAVAWRTAVQEFTAWAHSTFPDPTAQLDCTVTLEVAVARGLD
jgi:SAM-dependent methyltransferase